MAARQRVLFLVGLFVPVALWGAGDPIGPPRSLLPRHVPEVNRVRPPGGWGYDKRTLGVEDSDKLAAIFRKGRSEYESPVVYGIPWAKGLYVVVARLAENTPNDDHSLRAHLVRWVSPHAPSIISVGKPTGDSEFLRPQFFQGRKSTLMLAEFGADETWGYQAYEITGGGLRYLGESQLAADSTGSGSSSPLQCVDVSEFDSAWQLAFHCRLVASDAPESNEHALAATCGPILFMVSTGGVQLLKSCSTPQGTSGASPRKTAR